MTCIVGIEHEGEVYIGSDSCSSDGHWEALYRDEKTFKNGKAVFGYTSSWRMGQLLRYSFKMPDHDPRVPTMQYLVGDFIDAVRECFKKGGFLTNTSGVDTGGTFLFGYQGSLYQVCDDFQVGPYREGYAACGCGNAYSYGALHYIKKHEQDIKPEITVLRALEAAAYHSSGVAGPFRVIKLDRAGDSWLYDSDGLGSWSKLEQ